MFYIVATPIGNLEDISLRALRVLKEVDFVLCEDTRETQKIFHRYEIDTPKKSYHKFNEKKGIDFVIQNLEEGKSIAMVSDAGMPIISDPGRILIQALQEKNLTYTCVPGPSALTTSVSLSGLDPSSVQYLGFLPKKPSLMKKSLEQAESYAGVSVYFLPPQQVIKTLSTLKEETFVVLCKEMTKRQERVFTGSAKELLDLFSDMEIKGEYTLLVQGEKKEKDEYVIDAQEAMDLLEGYVSHKDAVYILKTLTKKSKKCFY